MTEVGHAAESRHVRHVGHGVLARVEQFGRPAHLRVAHQFVERHPRERFHFAVERGVAHAHLVGNEGHVHAFHVEVFLDDAVHLVEEVAVDAAERLHGFPLRLRFGVVAGVGMCGRDEAGQPAAVVEQVVDAATQQGGAERFAQVRVGACGISFLLVARAVLGSEQDDGDVTRADVLLHKSAQADAVHDGHHDVAHDDVGDALPGDVPSLASVFRGKHLVAVVEGRADIVADVLVVLHHEQDGACLFRLALVAGGRMLCGLRTGFGRMLTVERFGVDVVREQADGECAALARRALGRDGALMELHERLHQGQSDARTRSLVVALLLIVAFEDVGQGLRTDAVARVADADGRRARHAFFLLAVDADGDASLGSVLDGVRYEVVQDDGHDLGVKVEHMPALAADVEVELVVRVQFLVAQADFLHQFAQVGTFHAEAAVLRLRLAELQQAVDEVQQSRRAVADEADAVGMFG